MYKNYSNKVLGNLNCLRKDERFCDVDLMSGDVTVKAHRVVLAASCVYFDAMFGAGLAETRCAQVSLPAVPPDILTMIVDFIYTGEIMIDRVSVQPLMVAADMLQLRELVAGCGEFLRRELHPSNAIGIFRFAEDHNCTELAKDALEHAQAHWSAVAEGEELLELPLQLLIKLLSSEQLRVESESQVLFAALRWLEHDPASRRRHCFQVLQQVRLPLLGPQILDDAVQRVQDPSVIVALRTIKKDMKSGRGVLVPLQAEPRTRARRCLYLAGGSCRETSPDWHRATDTIFSSCLKFDMLKGEWTEVAPMSLARIQPGVAALGGKMYVVGGEQGSQILANGEVYDPQSNSWSVIAAMNEARCEFGLATWRGTLYALGGWVGADMGSTVEVYDPTTDAWTFEGRMPQSRFSMGVVSYDGLIYVVGGCTHYERHVRDLLAYNPATRAWRRLAPMRVPRSQAGAAVLGDQLYVAGGNSKHQTVLASVERYSFDEDKWYPVSKMSIARAAPALAAVDGMLLVVGGDMSHEASFYRARSTLPDAELYDPRTDTWRAAPALPVSRAEAGAAVV